MPDMAKLRAAVVGTGFGAYLHDWLLIAEAVARSARERRWIEVSS